LLLCSNRLDPKRREFPRKFALFFLTASSNLILDESPASAAIPRNRGSDKMNKQELIGTVAETTGLSRSDASKAVEGVIEAISSALKRGDEVRLVGFGTFTVSRRKASTGRNPRTGEPMQIKESSQPKFKAGKGLKDLVN